MMENAVRSDVQQLSPGFVSLAAVSAISACKETHAKREDRARCIQDALRLSNLTPRSGK
jgi:hypothetical protein